MKLEREELGNIERVLEAERVTREKWLGKGRRRTLETAWDKERERT